MDGPRDVMRGDPRYDEGTPVTGSCCEMRIGKSCRRDRPQGRCVPGALLEAAGCLPHGGQIFRLDANVDEDILTEVVQPFGEDPLLFVP